MRAPSLEWNPRFANYARVHGRSCEEQIQHDRIRWPGGSMCGFVLWNKARLGEYKKINPSAFIIGGALVGHDEYDLWLDSLDATAKD